MMNTSAASDDPALQLDASATIVERVRAKRRPSARPDDTGLEPVDLPPGPAKTSVWALSLLLALAGLGFVVWQMSRTWSAAAFQAAPPSFQRQALKSAGPDYASAEYFDLRTRAALRLKPNDLQGAANSAREAVRRDPGLAFPWAVLAFAETEAAGGLTAQAESHLRNSYDLCPVCDAELSRLRFRFILHNWMLAPDDLRRAAFNEAETLRWTGRDAEYLAEMKLWARDHGIPYDRYDAQVRSPVPSVLRPATKP